MHLQADIGRLRQDLGWSPCVALADGLKRTVDWYRTTKPALAQALSVEAEFKPATQEAKER